MVPRKKFVICATLGVAAFVGSGTHRPEAEVLHAAPPQQSSNPGPHVDKGCGIEGCVPEELRDQCGGNPKIRAGQIVITDCGVGYGLCYIGNRPYCVAPTPQELARRRLDEARAAGEKAEHDRMVAAEIARLGAHRAAEARKLVEMREAAERAMQKNKDNEVFYSCKAGRPRLSKAQWEAEQAEYLAAARRGERPACEG